jgi:hypothetical protein
VRRRRRRTGGTVPSRAPSRFCSSAGPRAADGRSERRGPTPGERVGGPPPPIVAASLAGRAAGDECGGGHPRPARSVFLGACVPEPAPPVTLAALPCVVSSQLSRPLDDQASAWVDVCHLSSDTPSLRDVSQFGGPLDHQASAWVGCLPFGVARPPGAPRCAPRPAVVLRRHTGHSPGLKARFAGPV